MQGNFEKLLQIALQAAKEAAEVHYRAERNSLGVDTKRSPMDLVTAVDRETERKLVSLIRKARAHDAIIGEEGTAISGNSGVCWIIDPLDGTTNFIYDYPAHAVAIGIEVEGKRVLGVVHDTSRPYVYSGIVGRGAQCNGKTIRVANNTDLSQALIGTGFLPNSKVRQAQGAVFQSLLPRVRDVRRSGCPALDLCSVAAGRLDAYYESGLGRWDIVAGAAIAEAAGAKVMELQSAVLPNPVLVVANAKLLKALITVLVEAGAVVDPSANL